MVSASRVSLASVTSYNHIITYNYKLPHNDISDFDMDFIKDYSVVHRQELLQSFAQETDEDPINFYHLIFDNGYDLCYSFQDKNLTPLYNCIFSAEEYYKAEAAGDDFRCDPTAFASLVERTNNKLPRDYMGDATLRNIMLDFNNNQIYYYVVLPEMNGLEMFITDDYLKNYITENWSSISDNIISLSSIDQLDLYFIFNTHSGTRHASIHFPYSEYSILEE